MFGLFNAIGNVASTLIQQKANESAINQQANLNSEFDLLSRKRNWIDTAKYWREYNSPAAQMRAYSEAGLNPNLIYNQGGYSPQSTNANNIDAPRVPQLNVPNLGVLDGIFNTYMQLKADARADTESMARVNKINADIDYTQNRQTLLPLQREEIRLRNEYNSTTSELRKRYLEKNIDMIQTRMNDILYNQKLRDKMYREGVRQFNERMNFEQQKFGGLSKYQEELLNKGYLDPYLNSFNKLQQKGSEMFRSFFNNVFSPSNSSGRGY